MSPPLQDRNDFFQSHPPREIQKYFDCVVQIESLICSGVVVACSVLFSRGRFGVVKRVQHAPR
jgi:hypothetical protein